MIRLSCLILVTSGCAASGGMPMDASVADDGSPDASPDTATRDTGGRDTGTAGDTGAIEDTGASDTGVADTGADTAIVDSSMDTSVTPVCGDGTCDTGEVVSCEMDCDLVPTMTSNTTPSGTVAASGSYSSSYPGWHVFDGTSATSTADIWLSELNVAPAWVSYEFASGTATVMRYGIRYTNGSLTTRAPRDWELQGWTGSSWATLDSQSGQTGWTTGEWRRFDVSSPAPYSRYRLYITADNDSRDVILTASVGELGLWGI